MSAPLPVRDAPYTPTPGPLAHDALTRMLDLDVHGSPVITKDGDLIGVVTLSDVSRTGLSNPVSAEAPHDPA
ncbi:CBS domain-containing protein [Deinococcus taeanensis]|nr:CBS domain-containing protein [Deinococcus taeanensis]UBV41836.1 CBS domain-containing protein [Deinococcus taeanensis]